MDMRRRAARTVALMSLFTMADTQTDVPIASFDGDGSDLISLIVGIEPVQAGSGDPSPDNIRPISGWTGATVTRTGKNLLRLVEAEAIKSGYDFYIPNPIPAAGSYKLTCQNSFGGSSLLGCAVVFRDSVGGTNIGAYYAGYNFGDTDREGVTTTITEEQANAQYIVFLARTSGLTFSGLSDAEIQIELGSTATAYEEYRGTTYPFPLGTTVYGGTLDVTRGKLTVDRAYIASYNGERLPSTWISDRDVYAVGTTPTTGAQVVYKLATPIVYDLTPTQVTTLIGTNNIWADTGDIKYIEYNI